MIAQLIERPTEKPGETLTRVRIPGVARYFFLPRVIFQSKLQTLVYDILPSTTAAFSYAIGSRNLSANQQFFVGAQTGVCLLQTTQIILDVCFTTDLVA